VFRSGNKINGAEDFEVFIRRRLAMQNLVGSLIEKNRRRHAIYDVSG